ncbi:MAG TPA: tetratricopeptide repeat protein [Bacillales bacterium]|nr:tetratricopeptide repeat protein [Bacillales bacterium]
MEATAQLEERLNQWNKLIRDQDIEQATAFKEELDLAMSETLDPILDLTYRLFSIRFYLLLQEYKKVLDGFTDVGTIMDLDDERLRFYYHFFDGILMYGNRRYKEAVENYLKAKPYLRQINDQEEIAEFKYKLASAYHRVSNYSLSLEKTREALAIFQEKNNLKRSLYCENLLGINNKKITQYREAEKHYKYAKNYAEKLEDHKGEGMVYHNLGTLYADQNLSESAICYLKKAEQLTVNEKLPDPEHYDRRTRILYVLARELFRTNKPEKACQLLDDGLNLAIEHGHEDYIHRFQMLQTRYPEKNDNFVETYNSGLDYFKKNEMWDFVMEYSEELAMHFQEMEMYKEANGYLMKAIKARKIIEKKGATVL